MKKLLLLILLLLPRVLFADLYAGASKVSITPLDFHKCPVGDRIPTKETVHTELYVRTLAIKNNDITVAFISAELIGMFRKSLKPVRDALPGINCVIGFTHTHSVPDTLGIWSREYIDEYKRFVQNAMIESVQQAIENLEPAQISFNSDKIPGLSQDYRVPFLVDNNMSVMFVTSGNKMISTLVNWSAHPTNFNRKSINLSGDYPAVLCSMIDAELGGTSLFFNGAVGGQITTADAKLVRKPGLKGLPPTYNPKTGEDCLLLDFFDPETGEKAPRTTQGDVLDDKNAIKRVEIIAKNLFYHVVSLFGTRTLLNNDEIIFKRREFVLPVNNRKLAFSSSLLDKEIVFTNFWWMLLHDCTMLWFGICFFYFFYWIITHNKGLSYTLIFLFMLSAINLYGLKYAYGTPTEIMYLRFGDLAEIVTIPGEIYPELTIGGREKPHKNCDYQVPYEYPHIRLMLSTPHKFIFGITNDSIGYIIPECLYDSEQPFAYHRKGMKIGQYNELLCLGPKTAGRIIEEVWKCVIGRVVVSK